MGSIETKTARFGASSIQTKLILFALIAALVPTVTLAYIYYNQSRSLIQEKIGEGLSSTARVVARESFRWIEDRREELSVIATTIVPQHYPQAAAGDETARNAVYNYLALVSPRLPDLESLAVLDLEGQLLVASIQDDWLMPRSWLGNDERLELGDARFNKDQNEFDFMLGAVIVDADRNSLGVLAAKVKADQVIRQFANQPIAGGDAIYLLDKSGRVLARSSSAGVGLNDRLTPGNFELLTGNGVFDFKHTDSTAVIGTMMKIDGTNWFIVAERPTQMVYADIERLQTLTITLGIVMLLVVLGLAYSFAHHLTAPLNRLTGGAMKVAGGDLDIDLEVRGHDEIAYLTRVFNNMVQRLDEGRGQLDAVNSKLREQNRELQILSSTDPLTGLYNRQHLNGKLRRLLQTSEASNQPFALMMLDLDRFKQLNDRHGHLAGDEALKLIAGHMRDTLRASDYAARFGGEEFVVLLPKVGAEKAMELAERLRRAVADTPLVLSDEEVRVTTSIGISVYPEAGEDPDTLINRADEALYQAKAAGRNRCITARSPTLTVVTKDSSESVG